MGLTESFNTVVSELLKEVGTSIPGHILSFDSATQIAKVQIGVDMIDVDDKAHKIAPIINVFVMFPGGDYSIEYEINSGDEGIILFSHRCIDGWKEQGGTSRPPVIRKFSLQDALFIPGFRSKPNKLSDFQNNGVRLRNKDGSEYIWLKNDGTAAVKVGGAFEIESSELTHNGVNIGEDHVHDQLPDSDANTQQTTEVPR